MDRRLKILTDKISDRFTEILDKNLTGIYIHGSVAFGCFNWESSDVDFIAVVENEPDFTSKKLLIESILEISKDSPAKGLEMSMVLAKDCKYFVYPTPYCLHFSNFHKSNFEKDITRHIKKLQGTDKDLAAHFTVINHCGITLCGRDKTEVFSPVPKENYIDSIVYDIENAADEIEENPVYMVLNLCRVLAYLQDGIVMSKADCHKWSVAKLPEFCRLIEKATLCYTTSASMEFDSGELLSYAGYMLNKINRNI